MAQTTTKQTEKKKGDLRLIPKKFRKALADKIEVMELGVLNNFGNALSLANVSTQNLENAVTVNENAIISSSIVGTIKMKEKGKGLDLRYLKEPFRGKYKQMEATAMAEFDLAIQQRILNLDTITDDDFKEILAISTANPFLEKFVINNNEPQTTTAEEFEKFLTPVNPERTT